MSWLSGALDVAFARRGPTWCAGGLDRIEIDALLDALREEHAGTGSPDGPIELRVKNVFGLTAVDLDLLLAAAAPDLDPRVAALYNVLNATDGPGYLTAGVGLELAGASPADGAARSRLRTGSRLVRHGLLEVSETGLFFQRRLRVPDRVLAHLLGDDAPEASVEAMVVQAPMVRSRVADRVGRSLVAGSSLVHLVDAPGASGPATARGAFESVGVASMVVDLRRRPSGMTGPAAAAEAAREAGLLGIGLVVLGTDDRSAMAAILAAFADCVVPVIVVDRLRWSAEWTLVAPLTLPAPGLDRPEREILWRAAVSDDFAAGDGWADLLNLSLTAEEIGLAGQAAQLDAAAEDSTLDIDRLRDAARVHGGSQLEASAVRIVPSVTLTDLILPTDTRDVLEELISWARHREELLGEAGLRGKGTKGSGLLSLFAGPPGTGKTLAAEAVAGELGLELYTVELSAVVDKYIGETEKNLERIIREAESLNVVLFFDEADAIFGSRSAVKEAKDRYANQEVSYLLQRMEQFDGIAILATNLRGNLDPAFSRRLHFVVPFNEPPAEVRVELWRSHLQAVPELDPADPIDVDRLASGLELAGGGIKNVVMAAAFAARAKAEAVGMRHVLEASARELSKMGRRVPVQFVH